MFDVKSVANIGLQSEINNWYKYRNKEMKHFLESNTNGIDFCWTTYSVTFRNQCLEYNDKRAVDQEHMDR